MNFDVHDSCDMTVTWHFVSTSLTLQKAKETKKYILKINASICKPN